MQDIKDLLSSLDPEILKQLQDANMDDIKKAIDETKEDINPVNNNPSIVTKTKEVKVRIYHVTIEPNEWEKVNDVWYNRREVCENDIQLRESSILHLDLDIERMIDKNKTDNKSYVHKFINDIYENKLIHLKSENIIGNFYYFGKERPKYTICLFIEELPFLDTPASEFNL